LAARRMNWPALSKRSRSVLEAFSKHGVARPSSAHLESCCARLASKGGDERTCVFAHPCSLVLYLSARIENAPRVLYIEVDSLTWLLRRNPSPPARRGLTWRAELANLSNEESERSADERFPILARCGRARRSGRTSRRLEPVLAGRAQEERRGSGEEDEGDGGRLWPHRSEGA